MASFPSKPLTQLVGSIGPVHALAYSAPPSTYVLTGSADRSIRLYNPSRAPSASTSTSAKSSSSSSISSSTATITTTTIQPPRPTQLIQTYTAHSQAVLDLSIAGDNSTFASCGGDRAVFLWDVRTAVSIRRFGGSHGHQARVNAVSFAGDSENLLVSGSFDASVRLWDLRSGGGGGGGGGGAGANPKPVMVLSDARDSVSCVWAWREGASWAKGAGAGDAAMRYEIVAGSVDGRVRTYDVRMGALKTDVVGASVTSIQRTGDGQGLLVGTLDSTLRLLDHGSGGLLKTYRADAFTNAEFRLRSCFGGRERWVLCGSESVAGDAGEVVVWDTLSGHVERRIRVDGGKEEGSSAQTKKAMKKVRIGADGKERESRNVVSCVAWKENGRGDQWCCAGTDGVVTVFGAET